MEGVRCVADDILIFGKGETLEEATTDHNAKLRNLLRRCEEKNLKLNKEKARLGLNEVQFIGHIISGDGLKPAKNKIEAVLHMPTPTDATGIRRLIGFVNYLAKFLPSLMYLKAERISAVSNNKLKFFNIK